MYKIYKEGSIFKQYDFRKGVRSRPPSGRRSASLVWQQEHLEACIGNLTLESWIAPLSRQLTTTSPQTTHNASLHPRYMSANFSSLQTTAACGVWRQVVVNNAQSIINNAQSVINDMTNLSKGLQVIDNTIMISTWAIDDLCGKWPL